jgi:hypothetical protein
MKSTPIDSQISLKEVAAELGVAYSTAWRWATRGVRNHKLPCVSIGNRRFTNRASLAAWLALINNGNELPASEQNAHAQNGEADD